MAVGWLGARCAWATPAPPAPVAPEVAVALALEAVELEPEEATLKSSEALEA